MNLRVMELLNQISNAENELAEIRKNCKHLQGYSVGMWSWRIGAYYPSRICNECHNCIEGITLEEIEKCWKEYKNPLEIYKF